MSEICMSKNLPLFNAAEYQVQQVRDLAWVIFGQPMMNIPNHYQPMLDNTKWFQDLDREPQILLRHLQTKNLKMLGTYFEALWEFFLEQHPDFELKYKNLQVFEERLTVGEFDFIFWDRRQNRYQHLEVAVKYYLGVINESQCKQEVNNCSLMSQWIGPGTRDRLDLKYQKLIQKQSQLGYTDAGRQLLANKGIDEIESQINLLGYLFYPLDLSIGAPENADPNHLDGFWIRLSRLDELAKISGLWAIVDKPHWLAPVQESKEKLLSYKKLENFVHSHFDKFQRPLLIAKFTQNEHLNQLISREYGFIVPDSWPQSR